MHPTRLKKLAGGLKVFGGHAHTRATAKLVGHIHAHGRSKAHAAAANAQIDRLIQAIATVLHQDIRAGNAQVGRAKLHIGGHVTGTHDEQAQIGAIGLQDEPSGRVRIFSRPNAHALEHGKGLLEEAALGQGQRDHADTLVTRAPRPTSFCSIRS